MFDLQRCKIAKVLAPISVAGGANATCTEVDTKGFRAGAFFIMTGLVGANGVTTLKWQESDTSGSGGVDITGASHTALVDADDGIQLATYMDFRGRKRYITAIITNGSTNASVLSAYAILYRAEETPDSATERGVQEALYV
jgi:hypothetical protein